MGVIASELTAGFVILPSCMGTLKSTRIRTRLPLTSRSVIASLFERDMIDWQAERDLEIVSLGNVDNG